MAGPCQSVRKRWKTFWLFSSPHPVNPFSSANLKPSISLPPPLPSRRITFSVAMLRMCSQSRDSSIRRTIVSPPALSFVRSFLRLDNCFWGGSLPAFCSRPHSLWRQNLSFQRMLRRASFFSFFRHFSLVVFSVDNVSIRTSIYGLCPPDQFSSGFFRESSFFPILFFAILIRPDTLPAWISQLPLDKAFFANPPPPLVEVSVFFFSRIEFGSDPRPLRKASGSLIHPMRSLPQA